MRAATLLTAFAAGFVLAQDSAYAADPRPMGLAVPGKPDLAIKSARIALGQTCKPKMAVLLVTAQVANIGSATSPARTDVDMVFAEDTDGSGWSNGGGLGAITPGTSAMVTFPVYYLEANPAHMTGTHSFKLSVNRGNWIAESNAANNTFGPVSITVPPAFCGGQGTGSQALPDLVVKGLRCGPGSKLEFTAVNNGPGALPAGWRAVADVFFDGIRMGHIDLGRPTSGDLTPPGGTARYLTVFDITRPVTAKVLVDATNSIREHDEGNNSLGAMLSPCGQPLPGQSKTPLLPDLHVADLRVNERCQIVVTVENLGPGPLPDAAWSSSRLAIRLSSRARSASVFLETVDPGHRLRNPGGRVIYVSSATAFPESADLPIEAGRVLAVVDEHNAVTEANEGNNLQGGVPRCAAAGSSSPAPDATAPRLLRPKDIHMTTGGVS
jgi:hypothetical protein